MVEGMPNTKFTILLNGSDADGDLLTWSVGSSNPSVNVSINGNRLSVEVADDFVGTSTITVSATDYRGTPHDPRGRTAVVKFDVSIGSNSIYGKVFWDRNNDGFQNGADRGVDGYLVYVDGNGNGAYDVGEKVAYSDVNGEYALRDIRLRSSPGGRAVVSAVSGTSVNGNVVISTSSEAAPFDHAVTTTRTEIIAQFDVLMNFFFYTSRYAGAFTLTPEMTADNRSLAALAADINFSISRTALANSLFVQYDAGSNRIGFYTNSGAFSTQINAQFYTHVRVVRTVFYADGSAIGVVLQDYVSPGALGLPGNVSQAVSFANINFFGNPMGGFSGGAFINESIELPPFQRRDTRTTGTAILQFTVDGTVLGSILLTPELTVDNQTLADLVSDLNQLLTVAGFQNQVSAALDGDHLTFSTVQAGSTKTLVVEVQQHWVTIRTTTRLDGSTFDETMADYVVAGGLGFSGRALATGSDKPQSSIDVYTGTEVNWIPGSLGSHAAVPVLGAGQISSGVNFNVRPYANSPVSSAVSTGSTWSQAFIGALTGEVLDRGNYPWIGIDTITLTLPDRFAESLQSLGGAALNQFLSVTGAARGAIAYTVEFDAARRALILHFSDWLHADAYLVKVSKAAADQLGVVADNDFAWEFAVQPGDVNGDGTANDLDLFMAWRQSRLPENRRSVIADINGDGYWDDQDLDVIRSNYRLVGANPTQAAVVDRMVIQIIVDIRQANTPLPFFDYIRIFSVSLTPEMTRDNRRISDLADDLESLLGSQGVAGHLDVRADAESNTLTFISSVSFRTTVSLVFLQHHTTVRTTYFGDGTSSSETLLDEAGPGALGFAGQAGGTAISSPVIIRGDKLSTFDGGTYQKTTFENPLVLLRLAPTTFADVSQAFGRPGSSPSVSSLLRQDFGGGLLGTMTTLDGWSSDSGLRLVGSRMTHGQASWSPIKTLAASVASRDQEGVDAENRRRSGPAEGDVDKGRMILSATNE